MVAKLTMVRTCVCLCAVPVVTVVKAAMTDGPFVVFFGCACQGAGILNVDETPTDKLQLTS